MQRIFRRNLGRETIDSFNTSENRGTQVSHGLNYQKLGKDNPGAKSQGMKQLMAGGGVALIGLTLVPLLSGLFG